MSDTLTRDCFRDKRSGVRLFGTWAAIASSITAVAITANSVHRARLSSTRDVPPARSPSETRALGNAWAEPGGGARREALDAYSSLRDNECEWEEDEGASGFDFMWWPTDAALKADYFGDLTSWMVMTGSVHIPRAVLKAAIRIFGPPRPAFADGIRSQYCRVAADGGEAEWRIARIGPFSGTGGFDWHRTRSYDPFRLVAGEEVTHTHAVVATALGPVDDAGAFLSNPPVHIHHANMLPSGRDSGTNFSRYDEWHGDSQCTDADGGVSCYLRALPKGYGFPLAGASLTVDADFNDVRPEGSALMSFSLEVAIKLQPRRRAEAPAAEVTGPDEGQAGAKAEAETSDEASNKALTDVGVLILGSPARLRWWQSTDFALTYFVPTSQWSAIWMTAQLPVSGTLVAGHMYTHQGVLDEAWVFSGITPEELGLNRERYKLRRPWEPLVSPSDAPMADLKAHVMEAFAQRVEECADRNCLDPPARRYVVNATQYEDGEARQMAWPQPAFSFAEGEHLTTIVFHKPMGGTGMREMQQHLALHGTYVPAPTDRAAQFHMVLPSDKPGWSAVDRSSTLRALVHFGGPDSAYFRPSVIVALVLSILVLYLLACYTALRVPLRRACDWLWSCSSSASWRERAARRTYGDEEYVPGDLTRSFYFKHVKPKASGVRRRVSTAAQELRRRGAASRRGAEYELVPTTEG